MSLSAEQLNTAETLEENIPYEPSLGDIFIGRISSIGNHGLFVECLPGTEGFVYASELPIPPSTNIQEQFTSDSSIPVQIIKLDRNGIRLSVTSALTSMQLGAKPLSLYIQDQFVPFTV